MNFEFGTARRILFGVGTSRQTATMLREIGTRIFLVTGSTPRRHQRLIESLESAGLTIAISHVTEEPSIQFCSTEANRCRALEAQAVVAVGGGAVLDAGKAIAALATNPGDALRYLEVIGEGKPLTVPPLPFIALPTTSGTGSEATRNAVLTSKPHSLKVSLRSPMMFPAVAIVDPELTLGLPPAITAATGMDALTQLIEAFTSCKATPLTDSFCREGIPRVAKAIRTAVRDGQNLEARIEMSLGSLLSGMALANSGLGAVHGFAAPIGGMFGAAHGRICAALLPAVFEINLRESGRTTSTFKKRFDETASLLTGNPAGKAEDGVRWLKELSSDLQIDPLQRLGIPRKEIPSILGPAKNSSSMKGNPVVLSDAQLEEILHAAW